FQEYKDYIIPIVDVDFKNLLYHSQSVISHYSSTVVYALLFHKRILVPKWTENSNNLTNKYPESVVTYCESINKFEQILDEHKISSGSIEKINTFLKELGLDTSIDSIDLIVNSIISVLNE